MYLRPQISYIICLLLAVAPFFGNAQGCNSPLFICQSDGTITFDNYSQLPPIGLPGDLCFDASNVIFIEFNTLSALYIAENNITFNGSAQVSINNMNCDTTPGTPAISAAVVAASNPCIAGTYTDSFDCAPPSTDGNLTLSLSDLQPDSTYYILINTAAVENGNPFSCEFDVSLTGPAVQYNLNASANPATIINGETSQLNSNSGFDNYQWEGTNVSEPNMQNATTTLEEEGDYVYTVSAEVNGCEVTDQALVTVAPALIIYNTMTPNGDGINDTWRIVGIERFPDADVKVYSRWGQLVHRTRGYQPWDGGNLPEATYYYVIDLNPLGFDTTPYTGYITIIR